MVEITLVEAFFNLFDLVVQLLHLFGQRELLDLMGSFRLVDYRVRLLDLLDDKMLLWHWVMILRFDYGLSCYRSKLFCLRLINWVK